MPPSWRPLGPHQHWPGPTLGPKAWHQCHHPPLHKGGAVVQTSGLPLGLTPMLGSSRAKWMCRLSSVSLWHQVVVQNSVLHLPKRPPSPHLCHGAPRSNAPQGSPQRASFSSHRHHPYPSPRPRPLISTGPVPPASRNLCRTSSVSCHWTCQTHAAALFF